VVCFRYIIVNTQHKGDNKDDDNDDDDGGGGGGMMMMMVVIIIITIIHGQFYWDLERPSVNKEKSLVTQA